MLLPPLDGDGRLFQKGQVSGELVPVQAVHLAHCTCPTPSRKSHLVLSSSLPQKDPLSSSCGEKFENQKSNADQVGFNWIVPSSLIYRMY